MSLEMFSDNHEMERMESMYASARRQGPEWVSFLDLCFDGGDSIDEAEALVECWLKDSVMTIESVLDQSPEQPSS